MKVNFRSPKIISVTLLAGLLMAGSVTRAAEDAKPLAFRGIMQDLNTRMMAITNGISREDWSGVAEAAQAIADHERPPMSERRRIMLFAGPDVEQFRSFDMATHHTAQQLADLARKEDAGAVIDKFAELQRSCQGCHERFRASFKAHFYGQP